jgi:chromosomal replication initiation ATPase DnaA
MKPPTKRYLYANGYMGDANANNAEVMPILERCRIELQEKIGKPVTVQFSVNNSEISYPELEDILKTICKAVVVDLELVLSGSRLQRPTLARHLFFYYASILYKYPVKVIGMFVGKDHSTVVVGRNKIHFFKRQRDEMVISMMQKCDRAFNELQNQKRAS